MKWAANLELNVCGETLRGGSWFGGLEEEGSLEDGDVFEDAEGIDEGVAGGIEDGDAISDLGDEALKDSNQ